MAATCLVWSGRERRRACGAAAALHGVALGEALGAALGTALGVALGARRENGGPVCQSAVVPCMVVRMVSQCQCHRTPRTPRLAALLAPHTYDLSLSLFPMRAHSIIHGTTARRISTVHCKFCKKWTPYGFKRIFFLTDFLDGNKLIIKPYFYQKFPNFGGENQVN